MASSRESKLLSNSSLSSTNLVVTTNTSIVFSTRRMTLDVVEEGRARRRSPTQEEQLINLPRLTLTEASYAYLMEPHW